MRYIIGILGLVVVGLSSCDKVENPYPVVQSTELNYDLYPGGDEADYEANEWPTFTENTNTGRNVMIEDFTGHRCVFCPVAAGIAHDLESNNPDRVFVSTVHAAPEGFSQEFQGLDAGNGFVHDFTCEEGLAIGLKFGNDWDGSSFGGNPFGSVSRTGYDGTTGDPVEHPSTWTSTTNTLLASNDLKINIQAETNFYESTDGLFAHIEVDVLDAALLNGLNVVVQLHEDSLVAPQKMPDNSINTTYVHRDVLRGCIDGRAFGQALDDAHKDANGKYYYNYSYELPSQYDPTNMHLLIYVRDELTHEIYQVIEKHFH